MRQWATPAYPPAIKTPAAAHRPSAAGCERIYTDHASEKLTERPQFATLLGYPRPGDTLVYTKLCSPRSLSLEHDLIRERTLDGLDTARRNGRTAAGGQG